MVYSRFPDVKTSVRINLLFCLLECPILDSPSRDLVVLETPFLDLQLREQL